MTERDYFTEMYGPDAWGDGDGDDDDGPVRDGEGVRVPMMLMDSGTGRDQVQRDENNIALDHGVRQQERAELYDRRRRELMDAWKRPRTGGAKSEPPGHVRDAAACRAERDRRYEERCHKIENSWRGGR